MNELVYLQENVVKLLLFFQQIADRVGALVDMSKEAFVPQVEFPEALGKDDSSVSLRQDIRSLALEAKIGFTYVKKIAQIYTEVSDEHIVAGFNAINRLCVSSYSSTEAEKKEIHLELDMYEEDACSRIKATTTKVSTWQFWGMNHAHHMDCANVMDN
jgi:hypothetical protein